jgi:hypothetical protein
VNVVILTILARDPNAPTPNLVDEQMRFDAVNLFAETLEPA